MQDTTQTPNAGTQVDLHDMPAPARSTGSALWTVGTLLFAAVAMGIIMWSGRSAPQRPGPDLPVYGQVPDFNLVESQGKKVSLADLRGHVWLADFFFATCTGPCPELTLRMRSVQQALKESRRPARLVSFTLDPGTDTPELLRRYAERYQADPAMWWFLTGDSEAQIHALIKHGFLQAVTPATDESPLIHSTRFVLVDQQGRIRAWYDGMDPNTRAQVLLDIDRLLAEAPEA